MTSKWEFPPGANDDTITSARYPSIQLNNSIISYLKQTASSPPKEGLGSARPVYINDIINSRWKTDHGDIVEEWCLVCTETYTGTDGWDACQNFTNPATTVLLYRDKIAPAMRYSRVVSNVDNTFDRAGSPPVTAALCSYGVPILPEPPTPSPNYDFSAPYPIINVDRNTTTGENIRYLFDTNVPAGRVEAIPTPQSTFGSPSPTPRPPTPRPTYSGGSDQGSKPRRDGIIVGSIFGALIVVFSLIALIVWQCKREAKRTFVNARGKVVLKPVIRRQESILESGDAPPAYEDIVSTTPVIQRASIDQRPQHRRSW